MQGEKKCVNHCEMDETKFEIYSVQCIYSDRITFTESTFLQ